MGKTAISIITDSTKLEILPSWNIYNLHSQVQSLGQRCWTSWLWCAFCRMVVWFVVEVWVGENTEKVKVDFFTPFYVKSDSIFSGPESDHLECLSLTNSLTPWHLVNLMALKLLMLRIMLATAFWLAFWLGSWRLVIKLNFCSDFEHKGWSRFRSWSLGKISKMEFVQHFAAGIL